MQQQTGGGGSAPQYVTELRTSDVLFGRGSGPNDHEGNVRFRNRVAERKAEYMATNHRLTKAKIAKQIVDSVYEADGRFLKKLEVREAEKLGFPDDIDVYEIADDDTVMEKAKQALRQNTQKNKGDAERRTPPPHPLNPANQNNLDAVRRKPAVNVSPPRQHSNTAAHPSLTATAPSVAEIDFEPLPLRGGHAEPPPEAVPVAPLSHHTQVATVVSNTPMRPPSSSSSNSCATPTAGTIYPTTLANAIAANGTPSYVGSQAQNHVSMRHLPQDENGADGMFPRPVSRAKQTIDRRSSLQIDELMDSFNKMKTVPPPSTAEERENYKKMSESTETMGTIEPMSVGSMAEMTEMSLGDLSIFKPNEGLDEKIPVQNQSQADVMPPMTSYARDTSKSTTASSISRLTSVSDASMTFNDIWGRRVKPPSAAPPPQQILNPDAPTQGSTYVLSDQTVRPNMTSSGMTPSLLQDGGPGSMDLGASISGMTFSDIWAASASRRRSSATSHGNQHSIMQQQASPTAAQGSAYPIADPAAPRPLAMLEQSNGSMEVGSVTSMSVLRRLLPSAGELDDSLSQAREYLAGDASNLPHAGAATNGGGAGIGGPQNEY